MTELYVAASGNDKNAGTDASSPMASLLAAQEAVRSAIAGGENDITVNIESGEYFLSEPLTFTGEDGPADGSVTWRGPDSADAVINAGHAIAGWREIEDGLFAADVPDAADFGTLFENGERSPLCRFPTEGYLNTRRLV